MKFTVLQTTLMIHLLSFYDYLKIFVLIVLHMSVRPAFDFCSIT
jgi:hypothetical protein